MRFFYSPAKLLLLCRVVFWMLVSLPFVAHATTIGYCSLAVFPAAPFSPWLVSIVFNFCRRSFKTRDCWWRWRAAL